MLKTGQSETINALLSKIAAAWPTHHWVDAVVIVGVSGGADSVALLHLLQLLGQQAGGSGELVVMYCDHNTRPQCQDEKQFVFDLATRLKCKFASKSISTYEGTGPRSDATEESLRSFRYRAFREVALEFGARYVVTAHHANDQIETILFRMLRGSGIAGLSGIPAVRIQDGVSYVRPMLEIHKSEILSFLKEIDREYCHDQTNEDSGYSRNFIRNDILPIVAEKFGDQFGQSILRISSQADEVVQILDAITQPILDQDVRIESGNAILHLANVRQHPQLVMGHLLRRIWQTMDLPLQEMDQQRWHQIGQHILNGSLATVQLPGKISVDIGRAALRIQPTADFIRKNDS